MTVSLCSGWIRPRCCGPGLSQDGGSLVNAGAQNQKTTSSQSSLGNKVDILISIWLSPLSSLSRYQTGEVREEEDEDLSDLSNTNLAPKDKRRFRAIEQNVKMLQDALKGVAGSAVRLEAGFLGKADFSPV